MQIRPDTAKERDLIDGDWAWIETPHGSVMQEVKTVKYLDPPVLHVQRTGDPWGGAPILAATNPPMRGV